MDRLQRECLRVLVDAQLALAEQLDPNDTMTAKQAIEGHAAELGVIYRRMLREDPIILDLLGEITGQEFDVMLEQRR